MVISPSRPAIRRAVEEAAAALRSQGAAVESIDPPDAAAAMRIYLGLVGADGGAALRRLLGDSPVDPRIARMLRFSRLPRWSRGIICRLLELQENIARPSWSAVSGVFRPPIIGG